MPRSSTSLFASNARDNDTYTIPRRRLANNNLKERHQHGRFRGLLWGPRQRKVVTMLIPIHAQNVRECDIPCEQPDSQTLKRPECWLGGRLGRASLDKCIPLILNLRLYIHSCPLVCLLAPDLTGGVSLKVLLE